MPPLDGHYRHSGTAISWDDAGVTVLRSDDRVRAFAPWNEIDGARQIGSRPSHVQLLVSGHVPPADPRHDPFSIAVNSDSDARRLLITVAWRTAPVGPKETVSDGGSRGLVATWLRPRSRRS